MIEFLQTGVLAKPRAVTSAEASDRDEVGFIVPSFDAGSLLLKNEHDEYVRLEWPVMDRRSDRASRPRAAHDTRRPLPPGKYTLTNYRIARRGHDGRDWFISATGKNIRQLEVTAGQEQRVELRAEIGMNCRTRPTSQGVDVQVTIMGEHHAGLTIYRDGKRIPLEFVVTDADGKELASGPLKYG